jgi:diadenosine tetraphosphate (Ap4A) HIT family hydrolase
LQIYEDNYIFIEVEHSQIPWLKIFTKTPYKELTFCDKKTKTRLFEILEIVESHMLDYYNPDKINIASFGNYLPKVHFHVMARFRNDAYFPEPMWGKKQRDATDLNLPSFEEFTNSLLRKLQ